ncbi:MAG: SEC59/DGK1/VTE5 family protein [Methanolobus sp.]|nr:SEC59/DGK1/VTE5 family protein [Methanolobus sp.]
MGDKSSITSEIWRQLIHIFTGLVFILLIFLSGPYAPLVFAFLLAAAVLFSVVIKRSSIPEKAPGPFPGIERPDKQKVKLQGTILLLSGVLVVLFLFPGNIVYASVAIVSLGDSVATIIGTLIGRHELPYSEKKTLEGTLSGWAAAFVGALLFVTPFQALIGSAGGMLIESLISLQTVRIESMRGLVRFFFNDNFLIPVFSSILMLFASI